MQTLEQWTQAVQRDNPGAVIEPAKPKKKHKRQQDNRSGRRKKDSPTDDK